MIEMEGFYMAKYIMALDAGTKMRLDNDTF